MGEKYAKDKGDECSDPRDEIFVELENEVRLKVENLQDKLLENIDSIAIRTNLYEPCFIGEKRFHSL